MHIAIIRFSSMGDIILQTPWIAWIKRQFPYFKITFITLDIFKDFVIEHPFIDETIFIQRKKGTADIKQLYQLAYQLKKIHKVDLIMDFHGTLRASLLRFFSFSIPSLTLYKRSVFRWLLVKFKWDLLKKLESHHTRLIQDFCFLFDKKPEIDELRAFLQEKVCVQNIGLTNISSSFKNNDDEKNLNDISKDYIVLSPVASFESKRWSMEKVKDFLKIFLDDKQFSHLNVLIIGGAADEYCGKNFTDPLNSSGRIINKQGDTSILESVQYLKYAKVCVTNDTGSAHIAESLGVPVLSLFGATSESFGFRMHLDSSVNISIPMSCRPCSQTGKRSCFQKSHLCMDGIEVKAVMNSLRKVLVVL